MTAALFTPSLGDKVQAGKSLAVWTVGEVVRRPFGGQLIEVANLHNALGHTLIGVPLSDLYVVIPYEARHVSEEVPTESEVAQ